MAQTGFMLSDVGRTISVLNGSGTTAITAGDIVYSEVNNDVLTGTAASARNDYTGRDVIVKGITCSATGYKTVVGVAVTDIPVDDYGSIALEGVFITPVSADSEAGDQLVANAAAANKVVKIADYAYGTTTTAVGLVNMFKYKCGKALTGGSANGKYIVWKLAL